MLKARLEHIMSEDVVTLDETATVGQAAHILLRFRINGVLITRNHDRNDIRGIFTTSDLLMLLDEALSKPGHRLDELEKVAHGELKDVVQTEVLKIDKDAKIERVIALMHKKNQYTVPIFDGDKLVGVVGRHDILNAAFA